VEFALNTGPYSAKRLKVVLVHAGHIQMFQGLFKEQNCKCRWSLRVYVSEFQTDNL